MDDRRSENLIKWGIWAYFLLLIFEGALRKWILPGFATPLLLVRDPIALWLIIFTVTKKGLSPNLYLNGTVLIGTVSIFTAIFLGHKNLLVAIYGARILLLHFPLIFVIGKVFSYEDVVKVGRFTVALAIPMALLLAVQFYSPQSAWVNRGVGGDIDGAGFDGAMGYFRAPTTFSFTNGTTLFFGLTASFVIFFWLRPIAVNKIILVASSLSLVAAIPLSISRSLLSEVALSCIFAIIAIMYNPKHLGKILIAASIGIGSFLIFSNYSFFTRANQVFSTRFENATKSEGGVKAVFLDRFLGGMVNALSSSSKQEFFGYGIGMGTNVGSKLLTGKVEFTISEGEWGRLVGELGPLLGITLIMFRAGMTLKIFKASYRKLLGGNLLPWMLLSFGFLLLFQGGWAQPTALGFSTIIGGLIVASLKTPDGVKY